MKGKEDEHGEDGHDNPRHGKQDIHGISRNEHVTQQSTDEIVEKPQTEKSTHNVASTSTRQFPTSSQSLDRRSLFNDNGRRDHDQTNENINTSCQKGDTHDECQYNPNHRRVDERNGDDDKRKDGT
jgi:hypothetical protein